MILKNKFTFAGENNLMPADLRTALLGVFILEIAFGIVKEKTLLKKRAARAARRRLHCAMLSELKRSKRSPFTTLSVSALLPRCLQASALNAGVKGPHCCLQSWAAFSIFSCSRQEPHKNLHSSLEYDTSKTIKFIYKNDILYI